MGLGCRVVVRLILAQTPRNHRPMILTLALALTLSRLGHVLLDELEEVARAEEVEAGVQGQTFQK